MDIREDSLLGVPVLKISGEIDHSSASDFDRSAQAHTCLGDHRLIVDLTSCRYIDSGGLAVFLYLTRHLPALGWLAVVGADRNVRRLFQKQLPSSRAPLDHALGHTPGRRTPPVLVSGLDFAGKKACEDASGSRGEALTWLSASTSRSSWRGCSG